MEKYFPFDSSNGDRVYKSQDWVNYYQNFITSGLVHNNGKVGLNLKSVSNYELTLSEGSAFIEGRNYVNTGDLKIVLDIPELNTYRKDFIVLRCDTRMSERNIKVVVLKGEPSLTENDAPLRELERSQFIYDLGLYTVLVRPQATEINISDIEDVRGQSKYCQLSNPKGFGGSSIFTGKEEPPAQFTKPGDIWMDELEA